jgi:uncharacterized protein (DUF885 family)
VQRIPILLLAALPLATRAAAQDPSSALDRIAEEHFEALLPLNPTLASSIGDHRFDHLWRASFDPRVRAEAAALNRRTRLRLEAADPAALDPQRRLTFEVLRWNVENAVAAERFPSHLLPLNQFFSFASGFAQLGSGAGVHPFRTPGDYDAFLSRVGGFEEGVDAAIANMREGMAAGVVQPRVLMELTLPQLAAHVVDDPERSLFRAPIRAMPGGFPAAERERLTAAYDRAIRDRIVPAYRRLHDFVRDEYLPATRATVGLSDLPDGRAWYEHLVRSSTTTALTPEEIHRIGVEEVARIHREMEGVMRRVGFAGTLQEFFRHVATEPALRYASREEMLEDYRQAQAAIDASTDRLFDFRPRAGYEIRPVEEFRERSASGGSYQAASPDGSRPGIFYLNTYRPETRGRERRESLLLHEGSPGHHFQISIQRELEHLPRVRRFGGFTAYIEGWGLYAETLGPELGLYTDPYQHYGALSGELWRAIRLVLDTGIHAMGWTRQQAIDYGRENSSLGEAALVSEVERFIAIPSQALAYKIGEMRITELRRRAEGALGDRFDIRAFHRAVLQDGALPLDVLEARMDRWIEERRSATRS